jgi:hypothetical protein
MEGKGIDELKKLVDGWLQEMQEQKKMAMAKQQQEMDNNPLVMKNKLDMAKLQHQQVKDQGQLQVDIAKLKHDQNKVISDLKIANDSNQIAVLKAMTERFAKTVDLQIKKHDMKHRHLKEAVEVHHKVSMDKKHQGESKHAQ